MQTTLTAGKVLTAIALVAGGWYLFLQIGDQNLASNVSSTDTSKLSVIQPKVAIKYSNTPLHGM